MADFHPQLDKDAEKLWFTFSDAGQAGPFSQEEILERLRAGDLSPLDHIWKPGFSEWQVFDECVFFRETRNERQKLKVTSPFISKSGLIKKEETKVTNKVINRRARPSRTGLACVTLLTIVFLGAYRLTHFKRVPPIPEVAKTEYQELRAAILQSLSDVGPSGALAIKTTDVLNPSFYVATNLPDGAQFDIQILGVPETLVGQLSYERSFRVMIRDGLGKTPPFHLMNGKSLVEGEYRVNVVGISSSGQPTSELHFQKAYFLGGNKNGDYQARLRQFRARVQEQSQLELAELRQVTKTLETGLSALSSIMEHRPLMQARSEFDRKWEKIEWQIKNLLSHPGSVSESGQLVHNELYEMAREGLSQLTLLRTGTGGSVESVSQAEAVLQSLILALNTKIRVAELNR